MSPAPSHPDEVQRIADNLGKRITQRFVKSRCGWYVHTTHGCFHAECCPFAFTRPGIERKALRLARRIEWRDAARSFNRVYGEGA